MVPPVTQGFVARAARLSLPAVLLPVAPVPSVRVVPVGVQSPVLVVGHGAAQGGVAAEEQAGELGQVPQRPGEGAREAVVVEEQLSVISDL